MGKEIGVETEEVSLNKRKDYSFDCSRLIKWCEIELDSKLPTVINETIRGT